MIKKYVGDQVEIKTPILVCVFINEIANKEYFKLEEDFKNLGHLVLKDKEITESEFHHCLKSGLTVKVFQFSVSKFIPLDSSIIDNWWEDSLYKHLEGLAKLVKYAPQAIYQIFCSAVSDSAIEKLKIMEPASAANYLEEHLFLLHTGGLVFIENP